MKLIVYKDAKSGFEIEALRTVFRDMAPGRVSDEVTGLVCEFSDRDGEVNLFVDAKGESVALSWVGETSLNAIRLLFLGLGHPIRVVDEDYSFDIEVADEFGLTELRDALQGGSTTRDG